MEKNHAFLTFTASATHFLRSTAQVSLYNAKELFCKNNNCVVLQRLVRPFLETKNIQTY